MPDKELTIRIPEPELENGGSCNGSCPLFRISDDDLFESCSLGYGTYDCNGLGIIYPGPKCPQHKENRYANEATDH